MRVDRVLRATTRRRSLTDDRAAAAARRIARLPADASGQRTRPRHRRLRDRHDMDRARPVRAGVAAAAGAGTGGRAVLRTSSPRPGSGSTTRASPGPGSPWRFVERGQRVRVRPGNAPADPPDGPALRWAFSSSRPSGHGSRRRPRSRPRAAWPRRSSRRTTRSSSRAVSTRPTRRGRWSRTGPGVGIGAAHDIGPAIERAARGGRLEPAQFLEIATTLDATARLATLLEDERRPLLREVGARPPCAARPALDARPQLRPGR